MITWPAYCWQNQPSYWPYHLQNSVLIYWSYGRTRTAFFAFSDASTCGAKKKMMKFGWLGAEIWKFYSRRYFRQDITLVKLSLKCRFLCTLTFKLISVCRVHDLYRRRSPLLLDKNVSCQCVYIRTNMFDKITCIQESEHCFWKTIESERDLY